MSKPFQNLTAMECDPNDLQPISDDGDSDDDDVEHSYPPAHYADFCGCLLREGIGFPKLETMWNGPSTALDTSSPVQIREEIDSPQSCISSDEPTGKFWMLYPRRMWFQERFPCHMFSMDNIQQLLQLCTDGFPIVRDLMWYNLEKAAKSFTTDGCDHPRDGRITHELRRHDPDMVPDIKTTTFMLVLALGMACDTDKQSSRHLGAVGLRMLGLIQSFASNHRFLQAARATLLAAIYVDKLCRPSHATELLEQCVYHLRFALIKNEQREIPTLSPKKVRIIGTVAAQALYLRSQRRVCDRLEEELVRFSQLTHHPEFVLSNVVHQKMLDEPSGSTSDTGVMRWSTDFDAALDKLLTLMPKLRSFDEKLDSLFRSKGHPLSKFLAHIDTHPGSLLALDFYWARICHLARAQRSNELGLALTKWLLAQEKVEPIEMDSPATILRR